MTKEEVILTAVQWWSDKLASRAPHSNGDNNSASIMACLFADMCRENTSKEKLTLFEKFLTERLSLRYDDLITTGKSLYFMIGCDYSPDGELSEAAEKAGIGTLNFPFKTWMRIGKDYVEVSAGYGAPFVRQ